MYLSEKRVSYILQEVQDLLSLLPSTTGIKEGSRDTFGSHEERLEPIKVREDGGPGSPVRGSRLLSMCTYIRYIRPQSPVSPFINYASCVIWAIYTISHSLQFSHI